MDKSLAINIINDICNNSKTDDDILNKIEKWKIVLNQTSFNKLALIYMTFIYEDIIKYPNKKKLIDVKDEMNEFLIYKDVQSDDSSRAKAVIFVFMKYKKCEKNDLLD